MKHDYGTRNSANLRFMVILGRTVTQFDRILSPSIRRAGLTLPQFGVLDVLYHLGSMTVNQVIEKTLSSSGNMGVVVDNLMARDLVTKEVDAEDKRVRRLSITEKGTDLMNVLFPTHVNEMNQMMDVLTDAELDQLSNLMKKLGKNLAGAA